MYKRQLADDCTGILAIALLIDPQQPTQKLKAHYTPTSGEEAPPLSQATAFLACLQNGETATWVGS